MSTPATPPRSTRGLDLILLAWAAAVLVLNLPGHLSVDSLVQIAEGRTGVFRSWNPVFISTVFGRMTALTLDTGVLVVASTALLGLALRGLLGPAFSTQQSPTRRWVGYTALAGLLVGPVLLIYPGIVWKDVWFAHLCLAAFSLLISSGPTPDRPGPRRGIAVFSAMGLLAAAILTRQTAIIVVTLLLIGWTIRQKASDDRNPALQSLVRRIVGWAIGPVLIGLWLLSFAAWVESLTRDRSSAPVMTGVRLVAAFDMAGILAREGEVTLDRFKASGVDTAPVEASARSTYSPQRVDTLVWPETTGSTALKPQDHLKQWLALAARHPGAYLAHRWEVWAWQMGLREPARCLPVHVGIVEGPLREAAQVDWAPARRSSPLYAYTLDWVSTPYYQAWVWFLVSLAVLAWAARHHGWRHPMVWLQGAAVAYAASYAVVGIACDFRYVYFSVVCAQIGLVWLVVAGRQPTLLRKRRT